MQKKTECVTLSIEENEILQRSYKYTGATQDVHPLLSILVNYCQPVKFNGFELAEELDMHYKMSSFNENVGYHHVKHHSIDFVNYNKRQLSRIYPRGSRVDSSNFMPQVFWNVGCQMVALNFQTSDVAMQINNAKFEYNGNCGYILKPDFMIRQNRMFDPYSESTVDGIIAAHCSVRVISGQFLTDKRIGTYVEVDMIGLPADTIRKEFRTKIVLQNGLNPLYNEDPFVFRKIVLPDLAMLRFSVYEETGRLIGQRVLPLNSIRAGFRHISLRTEGNSPILLSSLFCHIKLKTYVPERLDGIANALHNPVEIFRQAKSKLEQIKETQNGRLPNETQNIMNRKDSLRSDLQISSLKRCKRYQKLLINQTKDMNNLKAKHRREQSSTHSQHMSALEKLLKDSPGNYSLTDNECKIKIHRLIQRQEAEWSEMLSRQCSELQHLKKENVQQQIETIRLSIVDVQLKQIRELEARQQRETQEMKASQVSKSMADARKISNNPKVRTKAEKERQIREINSHNTKLFITERKRLATKHDYEIKILKSLHQEEELNVLNQTKMILNHMIKYNNMMDLLRISSSSI